MRKKVTLLIMMLIMAATLVPSPALAKRYAVYRTADGRQYVVEQDTGLMYNVLHPWQFIKSHFASSQKPYQGFNKVITQKDMQAKPTPTTAEAAANKAEKAVKKIPGVSKVTSIVNNVINANPITAPSPAALPQKHKR